MRGSTCKLQFRTAWLLRREVALQRCYCTIRRFTDVPHQIRRRTAPRPGPVRFHALIWHEEKGMPGAAGSRIGRRTQHSKTI